MNNHLKRLTYVEACYPTFVLAVLSSAASAQITVGPPSIGPIGIPIELNMLQDPGFENTHLNPAWTTRGSYYETTDGDKFYANIGHLSGLAHSGSQAFDMGASGGLSAPVALEVLRQNLLFPVNSNIALNASIWALSGDQTLYVDIYYSDGTVSHGSKHINAEEAPHQDNGWQHWNFTSLVTPNKTIVAIDFISDSYEGLSSVTIDDAALTVRAYLPPLGLGVASPAQ